MRALEVFTRALEAGRRAGSEDEIAMSLNNLGFVHATDLADYDRGLEHHLQALAIATEMSGRELERRSLEELAAALEAAGRPAEALVTCSLGFAAFPFARRDPEALNWEQVVAVADYAAYAAKREGRNSWVGLSLAGDRLPAGKPTAANLEAWRAEGTLTFERGSGVPP